ncbi:Uncharacterized protein HZ326_21671 [Fusarium oxysporum f. sp. albedinis]|nr:Uncharacterized protein HZ326_21671 [Fusarium oxysporum f. sp. albedinis]
MMRRVISDELMRHHVSGSSGSGKSYLFITWESLLQDVNASFTRPEEYLMTCRGSTNFENPSLLHVHIRHFLTC